MYKNINAYLRAELEQFCADFVADRAAELRRRGKAVSGALANSFEYEVRAQALNAGIEALIGFEEHGRFIDMRRLQPPEGGADYIANLITWIDQAGLTAKMKRGYVKRRNLKTVPERVMTYIAFGIARKRLNGKYRRTRWYNKSKSAKISELYDQVLANMPEVIFEEIKAEFVRTSNGVRLTKTKGGSGGRTTRIDYNRDKIR